MSNIQVRINEKDKKEAKKIFDKLGLDMSSAIKLFLKQTTLRKGLPFLLSTENRLSLEEENLIIKASSEAKKGKNVSKELEGKRAIEYLKALRR
ncbi:MAG: type II toxin-antitoxin system RelB/DinJ family antitoxin [Patescibacteria group bacterium]|jgi:addiction module RelB/DinJ family antitoxin|nr:type II toxin-antitoxin system RelB/DinJ family antitoxin [Patescibacteria group bacterium]